MVSDVAHDIGTLLANSSPALDEVDGLNHISQQLDDELSIITVDGLLIIARGNYPLLKECLNLPEDEIEQLIEIANRAVSFV